MTPEDGMENRSSSDKSTCDDIDYSYGAPDHGVENGMGKRPLSDSDNSICDYSYDDPDFGVEIRREGRSNTSACDDINYGFADPDQMLKFATRNSKNDDDDDDDDDDDEQSQIGFSEIKQDFSLGEKSYTETNVFRHRHGRVSIQERSETSEEELETEEFAKRSGKFSKSFRKWSSSMHKGMNRSISTKSERRPRRRPTFHTIESTYGREIVESVEMVTFPADCYSLISLHGPSVGFFWFGLMVFAFQMSFLVLMITGVVLKHWNTSNVDDNPSEDAWAHIIATEASPLVRGAQIMSLLTYVIFADASMSDMITAIHTFPNYPKATDRDHLWCMSLSCLLRLIQGFTALVVAILMVFISNDVIEVILNFTALNFISTLDDVAFEFCKSGKYGPKLEEEVKRIDTLVLPVCMFRKNKNIRYWFTIIPLGVVVVAVFSTVVCLQMFNPTWDTQVLRVQFDDMGLLGLQDYNGCYRKNKNRRSISKRYFYESIENNKKSTAQFGFCIEEHQWYFYEGDEVDPCDASERVLIRSTETEAFDISTSFLDDWFTSSGTPTDLYFFEDSYNDEPGLHCTEFMNDGICNKFFNFPDYEYDGGDCCAATCKKPSCSKGGISNAFGSTNTTGDGYSNCHDKSMVPLIIQLNQIESSRNPEVLKLSNDDQSFVNDYWPDFWEEEPIDTLLSLYCNDIKVLKVYIDSSMENQTEKVMVEDGAGCEIRITNTTSVHRKWDDTPIWYMQYSMYHGNTTETLISQDKSDVKGISFFRLIPECYMDTDVFEGYINNTNVYNGNNPSSKALDWLMKDTSRESLCQMDQTLLRYALSALNFAAPIAMHSGMESGLWIKHEMHCKWPNIVCMGDFGLSEDLFYLDLSDLGISGYIPNQVGLLSNLARYDAQNNNLTGSIPLEMENLSNMMSLNIGNNTLTGSVPSEIGFLSSLTDLDLGTNRLTGMIPSEVGLLTNLQSLVIKDNSLSGSIPSEIGLLTSLTWLEISINNLTASIPIEIGLLTNLHYFNATNNGLTGSIPSEVGLLTSLRILDVSENSLTGSVPTEMENLIALERLRINGNDIPKSSVRSSLATKLIEQCILCDGIGSYELHGDHQRVDTCVSILGLSTGTNVSLTVEECDTLRYLCIVCNTLESTTKETTDETTEETIEESRLSALNPFP